MSDIPESEINRKVEVKLTIRGVMMPATTEQRAPAGAAEPAALTRGTDTVPPFPPPPVPGSAKTARSDDETFPEPNSRTDPIQVHTTSSQLFTMTERNITTEHHDRATLPTESPTCQEMTLRPSHMPILPSSSLTKTPQRQRLRFDKYDHFMWRFPQEKHLPKVAAVTF